MIARFGGKFGRNVLMAAAIGFFGVPIVWLLLAPTKSAEGLNTLPPLSFGSFSNLALAAGHLFSFEDGIVWAWLGNSVWYTALSVTIGLLTVVPTGYALAKFSFRGRSTILFATLTTMIVPPAALILPLYLEMSAVKLTNTPWSVILPLSFYPFGVYLVYLFATAAIPDSIIEAARLDGCSEFGIMLKIFIPLARPAIIMVAFFAIADSWSSFFLPYIMLTNPTSATLQTGLQLLASGTGAIRGSGIVETDIHAPEVALAALISVLPILLVFLFAQRHLVAGQVAGAEKG
jgi:multiple sugar transport system permease protein